VPVAAVAARHGSLGGLGRLWGVTLLANLAGGWGVAWLIMQGLRLVRVPHRIAEERRRAG